MKKSKVLISGVVAGLSLFLTACGNNSAPAAGGGATTGVLAETGAENVTIRFGWWGGQVRHDRTLEVIEMFEAEFPHITVEATFATWDDYWQLLNTQAAGNNLPDVIQMDLTRMNEFDVSNLLVDLNPFISNGTIDLSNVDDVYQEVLRLDGRTLGISGGANAFAFVINPAFATEHGFDFTPGYTWDEFISFLIDTRASIGNDFYGFFFNTAEYEVFQVFVRQAGEQMYTVDGSLGFSEQTLTNFFTLVQDMSNDDIVVSIAREAAVVNAAEVFHDGTVVAAMVASNQIIGLQDATDVELALALLPMSDGSTPGNWIRSSMSFAITSHSTEQEAAAKFIDFLTNSIEANAVLLADRGVPIASHVRDGIIDIVSPAVQETFTILDDVAAFSSPADGLPPAGQGEVRAAFFRYIEQLRHNVTDPQTATQQFMAEASNILN